MRKTLPHQKLRQWREGAGLLQREAAERAGVTLWTWNQLENGHASVKRLVALGLEKLTDGAVKAGEW